MLAAAPGRFTAGGWKPERRRPSASFDQVARLPISARNSSRVACDSRKVPSTDEVIITEFCFSTPRLDHHADALGGDRIHHLLRDLLGQPFLQLQPAGVHVDQAGELRYAEHASARDVADVAAAEERQHVMLAQAVDLDVLDDHHAVGRLREHRAVDQLLRIDPGAGSEELDRLRDPLRRLEQAFAVRILADLDQQLGDQRLDFLAVRFHCPVPLNERPIIPREPAATPRRAAMR